MRKAGRLPSISPEVKGFPGNPVPRFPGNIPPYSQLRLENFHRKKVEEKANAEHQQIEKKDNPVAGDTSSSKLILELVSVKVKPVEAGLHSPILQVDRAVQDDKLSYSFVSDYGEEDVEYALTQIFPSADVRFVSRVTLQTQSANHISKVDIYKGAGKSFSWPDMLRKIKADK